MFAPVVANGRLNEVALQFACLPEHLSLILDFLR